MISNTLTKAQLILLVVILWGVYSFYFITSAGINCSNDSSHFALAKTIYCEQNLAVDEYVSTYILRPDYAIKDSVFYSDRLPGTAFAILPFLAYTDCALKLNLIKPINKVVGITHPKNTPDSHTVGAILLANLCGTIAVFLFFYLCFYTFAFSFNLSLLSTFIFAFATLVQLESTHLFSHAPSMMLLTLALVICLNQKLKRTKKVVICASIIGFSTLFELQNFLYAGPSFLYMLPKKHSFKQQFNFSNFKTFAMGVTIVGFFLALLLLYNYIAFGEFFLKSNKYNPFFPEESSFVSALSGNIFDGLDRLFTSFHNIQGYFNWDLAVKNDTPGIFVANPVSLLSIWGMVLFYKKYRNAFYLFISIIAIAVLIPAMHVTTLTRHMFTAHALLIFPFVFVLNWLIKQNRKVVFVLGTVITAVVLLSLYREMYISANYWTKDNYSFFPYLSFYNYFLVLNAPLLVVTLLFVGFNLKHSSLRWCSFTTRSK